MENEQKKITPFKISDNARLFLKTLGNGSMNDGLKKLLDKSGFSEDEKILKKRLKAIMLEQIAEM
tara:strand:- start:1391 stop:1585 length:195 start_codon:yes stop_codon:yes gene_type:complete